MLLPALIAGAIGIVCALILIGYVIAAAVKAADDSADEDTDGDRLVDHCGWVDCPDLRDGPVSAPFHSAPLADGVQRDHV